MRDEDGFAAVTELGGIAIKIGRGETGAGRRIASVDAFDAAMNGWLADGSDPGGWGEPAAGAPG